MRRQLRLPLPLLLLLGPTIAACLPESPRFVAGDAGTVPPPTLLAEDGTGSASELHTLPRRPRLSVGGLFDDPASLPVLVRGRLDPALLSDAARSPWSAETITRLVPCDVHRDGDAIVLTPTRALDPGADLVLLAPAWARDLAGLPIGRPLAFELHVRELEGGAVLGETFPADGSTAVPSGLASFDVRFDDLVQGLDALELVDDVGTLVPTRTSIVRCDSIGFESGSCARLVPLAPLSLGRRHSLRVPPSVRDRFGDGPAERIPSFTVQSIAAPVLPTPTPIACASDEQPIEGYCVLVQDVRLVVRARFSTPTRVIASFGSSALVRLDRFGDVMLEWTDLAPSTMAELVIESESLDGARRRTSSSLSTFEPMAWLQIAEVRADAVGDEPAQEYVELWNASNSAIDVGGFRLSDASEREGDVLPSPLLLDADARLLVVGDSFDPFASDDARPPPGTLLARIGSSIGSGGLSNAGEPLYLRDALGRRIAEVPSIAAPGPGVCLVRLAPADRSSPRLAYGVASHGSCTPGTP